MTRKKLSLGATSMAMASALRVAVQIAVLPIIGRILGPHAYGMVALVSPFIFFSMLLAESGLGTCIVRAEKVTPALQGTVFCFSAGLGLVFMAVFAILAYPLGRLVHEPEFPALLMGMSSILLLASLNIVPGSILMREKKYNWVAVSDVASSLGGFAGVAVGIALHWGAWSLVAQQIVSWLCKITVVTLVSRAYPKLIFHWSIIRENMQFGSYLTGSSVLTFVARNIDNVLIGSFIGAQVLGYYALAFQLVGLPSMILSGSVYYTVFTTTSAAQRENNVSPDHFLAVLRTVLLIAAPALIGIAATAPFSIPLLLGEKWLPMTALVVLLTPYGIAQAITPIASGVLIGFGRSDTLLKLTFISAGGTILAILAGVLVSSQAVAAGVSLMTVLGILISLHVIAKAYGIGLGRVLRVTVEPLIAAIVMGVGVFGLGRVLPDSLPQLAQFGVAVIAGMALYAAALLCLFRNHFAENIVLIKSTLLSRSAKASS